jgi:predicted nicotinamide N-methyase
MRAAASGADRADVVLDWLRETELPAELYEFLFKRSGAKRRQLRAELEHRAQLWPSAVALATKLLLEPSLVAERRVLEVGSGLGLVSAAAAMAGAASVIATDREPDALEYARANAEENGVEDQVRAPAAPPQARLGT